MQIVKHVPKRTARTRIARTRSSVARGPIALLAALLAVVAFAPAANAANPDTAPSVPRNVTASPGDKSATVQWVQPASNGGSAINGYTVTAHPGGRSVSVNGGARSATVGGLTNGTSYTFTVRARNAVGTSAASAPSAAVTPFGVPGAPTNVAATAGDRSAVVTWKAPGNNGGAAITGYTVVASPGGQAVTVNGGTRTATVGGLTNGLFYTFNVLATNPRGAGPASNASAPVRPFVVNMARRLAGSSRLGTAIALSQDTWATAGTGQANGKTAQAVVLSRSDNFADALSGAPLAAKKVGPLLLTGPTSLDAAVRNEIIRILTPGRTVYVLGGFAAISAGTEAVLRSDGYNVVRFAGIDRFATATNVADVGLGNPAVQFIVTGLDFPDALAAGAAAAKVGGSVLLTQGRVLPAATAVYLNARAGTRYAIGGLAAQAFPSAQPVIGTDRYDTAVRVARQFFSGPKEVGVASGLSFADAIAGSAHIAARSGPMLLVSSPLPATVQAYLFEQRDAVSTANIYGGISAIPNTVQDQIQVAIT